MSWRYRRPKVLAVVVLFVNLLLVVLLWASEPSENPIPRRETPRTTQVAVYALIALWISSSLLAGAVLDDPE